MKLNTSSTLETYKRTVSKEEPIRTIEAEEALNQAEQNMIRWVAQILKSQGYMGIERISANQAPKQKRVAR